jgi:hypothetical protein
MRISRGRASRAAVLLPMMLAACAVPTPAATVTPPAPTTGVMTVTTVPPTRAPAATQPACFTRAALVAMPLEEIAAQPSLCFDSENGVQTEIDQAEAIQIVRAFLQDPTRLIAFREATRMANSPDGALPVARLEDEGGVSFLVAVVAGKVLEMDPGAMLPQSSGPALSQEELQAIAEDVIRRELPAFDELRERLTFEAGTKPGGLNFFRWEQPGAAETGGLPPLAQVGITDSGEIFSYINTLYFLQ